MGKSEDSAASSGPPSGGRGHGCPPISRSNGHSKRPAAALYPQVPSGGRLVTVSTRRSDGGSSWRRQSRKAHARASCFPGRRPKATRSISIPRRARIWNNGLGGFGIAFTAEDAVGPASGAGFRGVGGDYATSEAGKQKLRIETAIDRAGAPPGLSLARPQLPEYDGKASHAILITNEGNKYPLQSADPDPFYDNYHAAGHVEGKAAIIIRDTGSSGGILYHNNSGGTCGFCNTQIKRLLPEGATLVIVPPKNAVPKNPKAEARPRPHIGNNQLPERNKDVGKSEDNLW